MSASFDTYLKNGCMRCKYGGTPQCKVRGWVEELTLLRQMVREMGLTEVIKWGIPVYTHQWKNIITINALKASANIGFFKGVLLADPEQILEQQGNIQSARIIRFTNTDDIKNKRDILKAYITEAIAIEDSGREVVLKKNPEPLPEELLEALRQDPAFETAFYSLTPGRQRGYIIFFSSPKQSETRMRRIEKYKEQIFNGIGLHDKY